MPKQKTALTGHTMVFILTYRSYPVPGY